MGFKSKYQDKLFCSSMEVAVQAGRPTIWLPQKINVVRGAGSPDTRTVGNIMEHPLALLAQAMHNTIHANLRYQFFKRNAHLDLMPIRWTELVIGLSGLRRRLPFHNQRIQSGGDVGCGGGLGGIVVVLEARTQREEQHNNKKD